METPKKMMSPVKECPGAPRKKLRPIQLLEPQEPEQKKDE